MVKKAACGSVSLVGAGPGDEFLLTEAAATAIRQADVLVYDYLVDPAVVALSSPQAKKVYVGKRPGSHRVAQQEITRLLLRWAGRGAHVVRLKGGDPFVFGRGGEEALALAAAGVPFTVIPGISAGIAAPAFAGIPVTHRGIASLVTFVTGHKAFSQRSAKINWRLLARQQGTLVIFMGVAELPNIVKQLLRGGKDKNMPTAVIEWGTLSRQRVVTSGLSKIVAAARQAGITNPAITVIGEVVRLRRLLNWFETKLLFGKKILITRPWQLAAEMQARLTAEGAQCILFPLIEIRPERISGKRLQQALRTADWVVFTSRNSVEQCFGLLARTGADSRIFAGAKIAVLGEETRKQLVCYGLKADLMPRSFVMEKLIAALSRQRLRGKRVCVPHSRQGRPVLCESLRRMGARVDELFLYRVVRVKQATRQRLRRLLREHAFDWITFTSASCAREFLELSNRQDIDRKTRLAAIGPITARTMRAAGLAPDITAQIYTAAGLVEALRDYYRDHAHD